MLLIPSCAGRWCPLLTFVYAPFEFLRNAESYKLIYKNIHFITIFLGTLWLFDIWGVSSVIYYDIGVTFCEHWVSKLFYHINNSKCILIATWIYFLHYFIAKNFKPVFIQFSFFFQYNFIKCHLKYNSFKGNLFMFIQYFKSC